MTDSTLSSGVHLVRRACMRYVQNRDEANDLAQEVLLKVAGAGRQNGGVPSAGWMYRVAVNHCLDHLRREKRLRGQAQRYAAAFRSGAAPDAEATEPEDPGGKAEREKAMGRRVLERLRATAGQIDRHVIYLRFDLDLSQAGIAEILGVSRAAVGQRLARIHARAADLWRDLAWETAKD